MVQCCGVPYIVTLRAVSKVKFKKGEIISSSIIIQYFRRKTLKLRYLTNQEYTTIEYTMLCLFIVLKLKNEYFVVQERDISSFLKYQ